MLAIICFEVSLFVASRATSVPAFLLGFVYHGCADYARRDGDDGVAKNHDDAGKEASDGGDRSDVAIAHSGEGDDCPIDTCRNVVELGVGLIALHHVHNCSYDGDENQDKKEINQYLIDTHLYALHEQVALVDERKEFKHSEHTYEPERAENEKVACACQERNEGEVEWQCGKQVDDTKKAQGILPWLGRAVESQEVLDGEEEREHVFHHSEHISEKHVDGAVGFHECHSKAEDNCHHYHNVEGFARWRVRAKNNVVQTLFVFKQRNYFLHLGLNLPVIELCDAERNINLTAKLRITIENGT